MNKSLVILLTATLFTCAPAGAAEFRTGPYSPETIRTLESCSWYAIDNNAGSDEFKSKLRSVAGEFPMVEFDFSTNALSMPHVTFSSAVGFDAFRFKVPEGMSGTLYALFTRPGPLLLRSWHVLPVEGEIDRSPVHQPFFDSYNNSPWCGSSRFIAQPWSGVEGGREYIFWFSFSGNVPQGLHVSLKVLPSDVKLRDWSGGTLHGLIRIGKVPRNELRHCFPTFGEQFLTACKRGRVDEIRSLFETGGGDISNIFDYKGENPLALAISEHQYGSLAALLELGADMEAQAASEQTALMWAARKEDTNAMSVLLKAGADINRVNLKGNTALAIAAWLGKTNSVRFLLDRGADPTLRNRHGRTAHDIAVDSKMPDAAKVLEEAAAGKKE